jgi:hypothetical protein
VFGIQTFYKMGISCGICQIVSHPECSEGCAFFIVFCQLLFRDHLWQLEKCWLRISSTFRSAPVNGRGSGGRGTGPGTDTATKAFRIEAMVLKEERCN